LRIQAIAFNLSHRCAVSNDDETLEDWVVADYDRAVMHEWRQAHPGRPDPDYEEAHRWYVDHVDMNVPIMELAIKNGISWREARLIWKKRLN
jgi:hypothetical protein